MKTLWHRRMPVILKSSSLWVLLVLAAWSVGPEQVSCEAIEELDLQSAPSDLSLIQDDQLYSVQESLVGDARAMGEEGDLLSLRPQRVRRFIKTLIIKGLILKKLLGKKKKSRGKGYGYGPSPQPSYGPPPAPSYGPPPAPSYGPPPAPSYGPPPAPSYGPPPAPAYGPPPAPAYGAPPDSSYGAPSS